VTYGWVEAAVDAASSFDSRSDCQEIRSMNVRAHKPTQRARRRPGAIAGAGAIAEAQRDPEVVQLASAEVEALTADHQVKVALAAYFIAEKRGFEPGHELDDWLAAEAEMAAAEQPSVTKPIQPIERETIS
jgi:hypothetical protein